MLSRVEMIKLVCLLVEERRVRLREVGILKFKYFVRLRKLLEYCFLLEVKKDILFITVVKNLLVKED